jgi:effector-binding domain-containing protein
MDDRQHPPGVVLEEREPQPVLSIRAAVRLTQLTEAQGERLRELWSFMRRRGVQPAGPPFVRYHTFGEPETDLETGVPVGAAASGEGRIARGELPGGAAITTWHAGSHDGLGAAYGRLGAWLKEHGREAGGAAWEVYWWIDPGREPDPAAWPAPAAWRTQLIQPIK